MFGAWQANILDGAGNVLPAASIEVKLESSGAFATLWQDVGGTIPLTNPFAADGNGFARFYAQAGVLYQIKATSGAFEQTFRHVLIPDVLTLQSILDLIGGQTAKEAAAGVTPLNKQYPEGFWNRYFNGGAGATNDTVGVMNLLKVGYQGVKVDFGVDTIFAVENIEISVAQANVPPIITGFGVEFIAHDDATAAPVVTLINPHGAWRNFMMFGTFTFNSDGVCANGLKIRGCHDSAFVGRFTGINSLDGNNILWESDDGFGIYYNIFMGFGGGDQPTEGTQASDVTKYAGLGVTNIDGVNRMNANIHILPKANYNLGPGLDVSRNSDLWLGASFERNDGSAVKLTRCPQITFVGGYNEHNHQNYVAGGGVSDGSDDQAIEFTSLSTQVHVYGGNFSGKLINHTLGTDHVLLPGRGDGLVIWPTGLGFGGATPLDNGLNFLNDSDIRVQASGTNKLRWDQATDKVQVHVKLHVSGSELEVDGDLNHDGTNVGLHGKAPAAQSAAITDPSGGGTIDSQARTAIALINAAIKAKGITA